MRVRREKARRLLRFRVRGQLGRHRFDDEYVVSDKSDSQQPESAGPIGAHHRHRGVNRDTMLRHGRPAHRKTVTLCFAILRRAALYRAKDEGRKPLAAPFRRASFTA
jgi:hypothetical protein